jgi:hypothetical protein
MRWFLLRRAMFNAWLSPKSCPQCGNSKIRRSNSRLIERPLKAIRLIPYRCLRCAHRFFRFGELTKLADGGPHRVSRTQRLNGRDFCGPYMPLILAASITHLQPCSHVQAADNRRYWQFRERIGPLPDRAAHLAGTIGGMQNRDRLYQVAGRSPTLNMIGRVVCAD